MNNTIIPTGFRTLDALLGGGLRPGTLTVVGARPGMGRTSFARNVFDSVDRVREWTSNECAMLPFPEVIRCLPRSLGACAFIDDLNYYEGRLAANVRALRDAAREREIAIVAVVKLPRSLEKREDKRPILADFGAGLFGRGGAARYADNVIALYRESYYDPLADWNTPEDVPNAEVIVLKSAGSTGTVQMRFDGKAQKWRETEG